MNRYALAVSLALLSGCLDPVVGGRCAEGWTFHDQRCVPVDAAVARDVTADRAADILDDRSQDEPSTDVPAPTDARDVVTAEVSTDATDVATPADAWVTDARPDIADVVTADVRPDATTDAPGDVADSDATTDATSDATPDAATDALTDAVTDAPPPCPPGLSLCGAACVNLSADVSNCGACGTICAPSSLCFEGACVRVCPAPLVNCGGACVDPTSDPDNCGACGFACSTGICNGGRCRSARSGHLTLIGHDYAVSRADQNRVVGNAVFLSSSAAPRVLALNTWAAPASVANVDAAIHQVAAARAWSRTLVSDPAALGAALTIDATDVLLVYHQASATPEQIQMLSRRIAPAIVGFVRAGGVAVVLDGSGASGGTWPVAVATELLQVTSAVDATGMILNLHLPADSLAVGLPESYRAERTSLCYPGASLGESVVTLGDDPVVLHRVVVATH